MMELKFMQATAERIFACDTMSSNREPSNVLCMDLDDSHEVINFDMGEASLLVKEHSLTEAITGSSKYQVIKTEV